MSAQFKSDLEKLVAYNSPYESHLDFLGPSLVSAADTIEKTRDMLIKEAEQDPSIHLLLYNDQKKTLPWWSNVLHRLAIAQTLIEYDVKRSSIDIELAKDLFPLENEKTLRHVLTAILYSVQQQRNNSSEEKFEILKALTASPEGYERIKRWKLNKKIYIYKCIAGFLNCFMHVYRERPKEDIRVAVKGDLYGLFKTNEDLIGLNDYDYLLSPRKSMKWFAQEVAHVLLFDFEWEQAVQWASYVYKTLTNIK